MPANFWANQTSNVGELGEQLVAQWLHQQNWLILHQRWRCRWGEIDLIIQQDPAKLKAKDQLQPLLAFVEVKTRSRGNWDADGLWAITPKKQAKLWRTAELFLGEYPEKQNLPCRFDVALVSCLRLSQTCHRQKNDLLLPLTVESGARQISPVEFGQPVSVAGYRLLLQDYIPAAFD
ncbi:YraN family protein [Lyngbya aestuarii]|uniref:YraN family protein n=1 Tax=Lyngbya aestuarii TaxID=118322 RepID=UPI00403DFE76